jgi:hypothetical protein
MVQRHGVVLGEHGATELTLALPHSVVQWRGWPHREGWRNSVRIRFPSVSEGRHGVDSSLTWAPACVRTLNAPDGGAGMGVASP